VRNLEDIKIENDISKFMKENEETLNKFLLDKYTEFEDIKSEFNNML
jgi:hypothetical protein